MKYPLTKRYRYQNHAIYLFFIKVLTIIKNAKSPLLDGLNTATLPKSGVSQNELAKLTRNAGCQLSNSIEINQENINTIYFSQFKK